MRFTAAVKPFLAAFAPVARVAPGRATIPILANVLIEARGSGGGGAVTLVASDLDREATATTQARVERAGATTLPAHLLLDILRKLPDGAEFAFDMPENANGRASLASGRARFALNTLPAEDYPRLDAQPFGSIFPIPAAALARALNAVAFAISSEDTRYYLNGIYLHCDGDALRFVATDGHRLARGALDRPAGAEGAPSVIVPAAAVKEFARRAADAGANAEATVSVAAQRVRVEIGGAAMTTKLIDGTYPDYQRVIPGDDTFCVHVEREALRRAIELLQPVSGERARAMSFAFGDDRLTLAIRNQDAGSAETEIETTPIRGAPIEIGFNGRYMLDALAAFPDDRLRIAMTDPGSPALITGDDPKALTVVVMPLVV